MNLIVGKCQDISYLSIQNNVIISYDASYNYKNIYSLREIEYKTIILDSNTPIIKIFPKEYPNSLKEALICLAILRKNKNRLEK